MNGTPGSKLIPVLRQPRRDWTIPAPDAYQRLVKEKEDQARAEAYWKGTTPYGREISRRMLHRAWTLCEQNPNTVEVRDHVAAELASFPELRDEFILIFSKLDEADGMLPGSTVEDLQGVSCYGLATVLVLHCRLGQWLNAKAAATKAPSAANSRNSYASLLKSKRLKNTHAEH